MKLHYLFIIFLIGSCKQQESKVIKAETTNEDRIELSSEQIKNAQLITDTLRFQNIQQVLKANGVVDAPPRSLVSVSFAMGGYLHQTDLLPGSVVKKGQVLGVMMDQSYVQLQQDYLTAKAKMEYVEADFNRQKKLIEKDATSVKNFELVKSEYESLRIQLKSLAEKIRTIGINPDRLTLQNLSAKVNIIAPISGYISAVNVNVGKYVNPTDVIFEIVDPSDIHAAIKVFEKDLNDFKKGMKGTVATVNNPNKKYPVEVILVTKNVDQNRTALVHCHFEKAQQDLLPGMFLIGEFISGVARKPTLPEEAVLRYNNKTIVAVRDGKNYFELVDVVVDNITNGVAAINEVSAQLLRGKQIVVKNGFTILSALKNKNGED